MPHEVSMRSKEKLLEAMFIPGDAVCKEYSLTMVGNSQLFVEGVEAVKELSTELIKLSVRKGFLVVTGEKLHVEYYGDGEIMVRGQLKAIQLI